MAANNKPAFVIKANTPTVQISAANTNLDGTGTLVDMITGATDGTRVEKIDVKAVGTTTAGMVRVFHYDGTNTRLVWETAVSAITPSATVKTFTAELVRNDGLPMIFLPVNHKLKASTHNAETFNVTCHAGDLS